MKSKNKMPKTEEGWKKKLTPQQFKVLREKGTEMAFTGKYVHNKDKGMYVCAGCGAELFSSDKKFDSGTGWPSFWEAASEKNIELKEDNSYGMKRVEITCKKCGGHLGHLFGDGPNPTSQRYCINSCSLDFKKSKKKEE